MKIIFSRKGFDSQNGGMPSPIIDAKAISLPIPYKNSLIRYDDLLLGKIVNELSKGRITGLDYCHNDPDLKMGAFGQVASAQGHLNNQGVGSGDLFLFFGTFRFENGIEHRLSVPIYLMSTWSNLLVQIKQA